MKPNKYEKEVLRIMLKSEYNTAEIEDLIEKSKVTRYNFTGNGYFLELSNEFLPVERKVVSTPFIIGKSDDILVGFVLFIENKTLTIECYTYFRKGGFPEDIRTREVSLSQN